MKKTQAIIVLLALTIIFSAGIGNAETPSVVILGIDGMDPQLLQKFVDKGLMPHFKDLMQTGSYMPLGTSVPPQSPVAWSNFITGMDPGGHGIFDFIHRDPKTYLPVFSTADIEDPERTLSIGDWIVPMSKGRTLLLRKGQAFWQILDKHGIPYTIFRVPANFPPAESENQTLSGMGTPDLLGTYGTFSFFTNDSLYGDIDVTGGEVFLVEVKKNTVHSELTGPVNSLRKSQPVLTQPFSVNLDPGNHSARFTLGKQRIILQEGEWSDWIRVEFNIVGPFKRISGITRFYLRSVVPYFQLYATPINLDPVAPALPICTPPDYSKKIAGKIGDYYTQGMPEDTKALEYGMLNDAEFVSQTDNVMTERWRMLDAVLEDYDEGLLFFYVSTIDQSCHAMWRNVDPQHPAHNDHMSFEHRFETLYAEMDSMLAVIRQRIPEDATLIVMSDHGFAPFYQKFHLNTWLYQNGYLELIRPEQIGQHPMLRNVFWRRTKAYAMGINGMYVNMLGRESKGIIRSGKQFDDLVNEISGKLLALRDPKTGERIVTTVYKTSEIYHGAEAKDAPDLVIGYNRGYRCSDESALGTLTTEVMTPNLGKWTGDHCMDHNLVPGIVLSNRPITINDPDLKDLPPTILRIYGIEAPSQMRGRLMMAP